MKYFPPTSLSTVDYVANVAHNDAQMMADASGLARLLSAQFPMFICFVFSRMMRSLDNWDGSGKRAADFGTRQVPGDDPHPAAQGQWTSLNIL
jgi:hypothetical protein